MSAPREAERKRSAYPRRRKRGARCYRVRMVEDQCWWPRTRSHRLDRGLGGAGIQYASERRRRIVRRS